MQLQQYRMETYVHKQDSSNYLNDNLLQQVGCVWQRDPRRGKEQIHVHVTNHFLCFFNPSKFKSFITQPGFGLVYSIYHHFQQYFSYTVVVSFIDGGGNLST